ncbi:hypothetical protein PROFUN_02523 [Planoprotostelium fungivorum]|uniref:Uncharacterized protein n=1 Tax=Planoprotostelium fungivorum TaxID=1890364 RepID=A0A2P6MP80_9EUKA|nr:hypothetical protein PROFUN_02523 [Planoprotostelium fungivorum]
MTDEKSSLANTPHKVSFQPHLASYASSHIKYMESDGRSVRGADFTEAYELNVPN